MIIDIFQLIHINEKESSHLRFFYKTLGQLFLEIFPVRQTCQPVKIRQTMHFFLHL